MKGAIFKAAGWLGLCWPFWVNAELLVDVHQDAVTRIPVAVVAVDSGSSLAAQVVEADLSRSSAFEVLAGEGIPSNALSAGQVGWDQLADVQAEYLIAVQTDTPEMGKFHLEYQLLDVLQQRRELAHRLEASSRVWRRVAHQAADSVHKQLTGVRGAFDTRIAYISQSGRHRATRYHLYIADADGQNDVAVLTSPYPLLAPDWSPDARNIAYVSFETGRPQVFTQNLARGGRKALPYRNAHSSAPAFSPDGRYLAMTMSIKGDTEIFIYDLQNDSLRRFTYSAGIDTEPDWSTDGQSLFFTSDRSGKPKLYRQGLRGEDAEVLPISGTYSTSIDVSNDGRYAAFVHQTRQSGYGISLIELDNKTTYRLSVGALDEAPSFAPNGLSLLYAGTSTYGRKVLMLISRDGKIQQQLEVRQQNVREPAWSPYRN